MRCLTVLCSLLTASSGYAQHISTEELRAASDYCHGEYLALTRTHQLPSKELLTKCQPVHDEMRRREKAARDAAKVKADEIFERFPAK